MRAWLPFLVSLMTENTQVQKRQVFVVVLRTIPQVGLTLLLLYAVLTGMRHHTRLMLFF